MKLLLRAAAAACMMALAISAAPAHAQGVTRVCVESVGANGSNNCVDASVANPFPVTGTLTESAVPIAPIAGTAHTIATGGTPVIFVTGPVNGCYMTNPLTAADEGISTTEPLYVNPVTTATANGAGTNSALQPGQNWACPGPLKSGSNVSAIAATSGHTASVVVW